MDRAAIRLCGPFPIRRTETAIFGIGQLAICVIVVVLLLGAKKLPDLARSAGKSARILKSEARALKNEDGPASEQGEQRRD